MDSLASHLVPKYQKWLQKKSWKPLRLLVWLSLSTEKSRWSNRFHTHVHPVPATVWTMTQDWFYRSRTRLWQTCSPLKPSKMSYELPWNYPIYRYSQGSRSWKPFGHKKIVKTITDEALSTWCVRYQWWCGLSKQLENHRPAKELIMNTSPDFMFKVWKGYTD